MEKECKRMLKVKVKYHDENMPRLEKIVKGNWIDLRAIEGGTITRDGIKSKAQWETVPKTDIDGRVIGTKKVLKYKKGDFIMICLGVTIAQPDGYELYLLPRSSTYKNYGLVQANSMGMGDDTFRGNNDVYHMPCIAMRDGEIELYDRVAQFRLQEVMPDLEIEEVEDTGYDNRGGFGSTGTK